MKIKLEIDSLDLHYAISLASIAKPRRKLLSSLTDSVPSGLINALTKEDKIKLIEDAIEDIIIRIGNFPGNRDQLSDDVTLTNLQFGLPMYARLSSELTDLLRLYNGGTGDVSREEVIEADMVGKIKIMVKTKLKP